MRKFIFLGLIVTLSLYGIEAYKPDVRYYSEGQNHFIITRSFEDKAKRYYLATNTHTLQTRIIPAESIAPHTDDTHFKTSLFAKALNHATMQHVKGGEPHARTQKPKAVFLTMDMCPSRKNGYESDFIAHLVALNGKTPIAVAISSAWIEHHLREFEALRSNPLLDITWVNHTHTHFYDKTLSNDKNFMLHVSTDVAHEILALEKTLLEKGITPSVFFRFPGLIADAKLMKELRETYVLIPLGADAWIAKHEVVKEGSIVLIHGNKNEPEGILMLEHMLPDLLKRYTFEPIFKAFVP
jgi:hypothetical protein